MKRLLALGLVFAVAVGGVSATVIAANLGLLGRPTSNVPFCRNLDVTGSARKVTDFTYIVSASLTNHFPSQVEVTVYHWPLVPESPITLAPSSTETRELGNMTTIYQGHLNYSLQTHLAISTGTGDCDYNVPTGYLVTQGLPPGSQLGLACSLPLIQGEWCTAFSSDATEGNLTLRNTGNVNVTVAYVRVWGGGCYSGPCWEGKITPVTIDVGQTGTVTIPVRFSQGNSYQIEVFISPYYTIASGWSFQISVPGTCSGCG